jgi:hypothetical protein
MAIVKKVDKRIKTTISDTTQYQILTHCFFNKIQISTADLACLALLAELGEHELTDFCKLVVMKNIFKSPQSARNAITKAEKKNLIIKDGKNKKTIILSKDLKVEVDKLVFLDFKILGKDESKES